MDPSQLRYATTHEWVGIDGDVATVGITDFAVKQLTDLVYIDLPKIGATFDAGEPFGEVESVKAVSDLYAPLAGKVVAVNTALADNLAVLSEDPYNKGWMIKLKVADAAGADHLLDRASYEAQLTAE